MDVNFNSVRELEGHLRSAARELGWGEDYAPEIKGADARFGDLQSNGVLPYAKGQKTNPRALAESLLQALQDTAGFDSSLYETSVAGPGFINFRFTPAYLLRWLQAYYTEEKLQAGAGGIRKGEKVVVDYSSPNTAKEMHVGHLRSAIIGEAVCRLLEFCGAEVLRDNHIGDWGTQFGMLIWAVKQENYDLDDPGPDALREIEALYKKGSTAYRENEDTAKEIRGELVKLQHGEAENTRIWTRITEISWSAFTEIYDRLGIHFDTVLGESFYRDKVENIYGELSGCDLAVESEGALVVFHPEHPRFKEQPFIIRKQDGASNYATTDLATVLHRYEEFKANEVLYVVDFRQGDHFEQLFLTVEKWFKATGRAVPYLKHISFGTVKGEDGKAIKTKSGASIKLKDLLNEAVERARTVVEEKNPDFEEAHKERIAEVVGVGAVKYVDLSQNRTSDYVFSWPRMLALEGNTAPYLLYAVARIHSIFRKAEVEPGTGEEAASDFETETELALARKLAAFPLALEQTLSDLRPHLLSNYLYELTASFSAFYYADRVLVDEAGTKARRLILCHRTLLVLEKGLHLLGLETLERM